MPRPRSAPIENGKRYSVTMPTELFERLKKAAAADNRSPSAWMIPHLEAAVEKWEKQKNKEDPLYPSRTYLVAKDEDDPSVVEEDFPALDEIARQKHEMLKVKKTLKEIEERMARPVEAVQIQPDGTKRNVVFIFGSGELKVKGTVKKDQTVVRMVEPSRILDLDEGGTPKK